LNTHDLFPDKVKKSHYNGSFYARKSVCVKTRVLTGITTTGIPHLGNYVGAIRPAIAASKQENVESYLFLANYHGIIKCHEPERIHQSPQAVARSHEKMIPHKYRIPLVQ